MPGFSIPLPKSWHKHVQAAVLDIISLAHWSIIYTRSMCANSSLARVRLTGQVDRLKNEVALLKEEMRLKDARFSRVPPKNRPHYLPGERMSILELRAARGLNKAQTARTFLIEPETVTAWLKRLDECGKQAFINIVDPINKFGPFVLYIVQRLKVLCPTMGKRKIAASLCRAGLWISASAVLRFLKTKNKPKPVIAKPVPSRKLKSKYPNHIWNVDLTVIPTSAGFWVRWFPFSQLLHWPFCYWAGVIVDHYSRTCIGVALFKERPGSKDVQAMLKRAFRNTGKIPKHMITDKGKEFDCASFQDFCKDNKHNIGLRYGAVQKHGSISVVERFIRTLKNECTRRIIVPLDIESMRDEVSSFVNWYNCFRPHQGLNGRFSIERYFGKPKRKRPYKVKGPDAEIVELFVSYFGDKPNLPIVSLRKSA